MTAQASVMAAQVNVMAVQASVLEFHGLLICGYTRPCITTVMHVRRYANRAAITWPALRLATFLVLVLFFRSPHL